MADRSTGPVKPPVIDLTPRNTNTRPEPPAAESTAQARRRRAGLDLSDTNWPLLGGVAVTGAVLGTALTYAVSLLLPVPGRAPDLSAPLATETARVDDITTRLISLEGANAEMQVTLDATVSRLDSGIADLGSAIDAVRDAIPEPLPPVDLTPLEAQLATLKAQVDAIAAGASGADASAIAASLATIDAGLQSLGTRLNGVDQTIVALRTDIETTRTNLASHIDTTLPNEAGPLLRLPLILSGLEGAFEYGRPFQSELDAIRAMLPELAVPAELAAAANTGLVRPDTLAQRFRDTLPAMLGARDTANEDWVQSAMDWTSAVLALRPAEEMEGDSPEAIVSRMEGAMARKDYLAASSLLASLPPAMQAAAAPVAADIAAHAAAERFVTDLRARALNTAAANP